MPTPEPSSPPSPSPWLQPPGPSLSPSSKSVGQHVAVEVHDHGSKLIARQLACLRVQACRFVRWRRRVVVWVASDVRRLMSCVKVWLVGVPREALDLVNGVLAPSLERGMMRGQGRQAHGTWSSRQAWQVAPLCLAHRPLTFGRLHRAIEKRKRR